jgi:hypothetical protein
MKHRDWMIELEGEERDLELLSDFVDSKYYKVEIYNKKTYLRLVGIDIDIDSVSLQEMAQHAIDILNGSARLFFSDCGMVGFIKVVRFINEENLEGFGYLSLNKRSISFTLLPKDSERFNKYLEIARENEEIGKALFLYGALEHNWRYLYNVYEIVKEALINNEEYSIESMVSGTDIERFGKTANSFQILGKEARHGVEKREVPPDPMNLPDAQRLIRELLILWIGEMIGS